MNRLISRFFSSSKMPSNKRRKISSKNPDVNKGVKYWENTPATVDGVLGGFGERTPVPRLDALESRLFLLSLLPFLSTIPSPASTPPIRLHEAQRPQKPFVALDCGAGIGRVTRETLLPLFDSVYLLEPAENFVKQAKQDIQKGQGKWSCLHPSSDGVSTDNLADPGMQKEIMIFKETLQRFDPSSPLSPYFAFPNSSEPQIETKFDVIWIQWCLGHSSDKDLTSFLKRCIAALKPHGYIVVKENVCDDNEPNGIIFDEEDSSLTRSQRVYEKIFTASGLEVKRRETQKGFPTELFAVKMWALKPESSSVSEPELKEGPSENS